LTPEERDYKGLKGEYKTIFSKTLEKVKSGEEKFTDSDATVYQQAIDFENRGVKMYASLYDETTDEKAKKFYAFLREMEQDHADVLDNTFQFMKDPKNWYMQNEGWTLDD